MVFLAFCNPEWQLTFVIAGCHCYLYCLNIWWAGNFYEIYTEPDDVYCYTFQLEGKNETANLLLKWMSKQSVKQRIWRTKMTVTFPFELWENTARSWSSRIFSTQRLVTLVHITVSYCSDSLQCDYIMKYCCVKGRTNQKWTAATLRKWQNSKPDKCTSL